jgi:hypothetical protein
MAKGTCPGCRSGMKVKARFCPACGHRNPLFPARRGRPPAAAKAAGRGPVAEPGAFGRHPLAGEFFREADPARREVLAGIITKAAGPQYAAVHSLADRAAWAEVTAEPDPGRREALIRARFGAMTGGDAA